MRFKRCTRFTLLHNMRISFCLFLVKFIVLFYNKTSVCKQPIHERLTNKIFLREILLLRNRFSLTLQRLFGFKSLESLSSFNSRGFFCAFKHEKVCFPCNGINCITIIIIINILSRLLFEKGCWRPSLSAADLYLQFCV